MSAEKVTIKNPETGEEAEVVKSSLNAWLRHGWTLVEDEGSSDKADDLVVVPDQVAPAPATKKAPAAQATDKKE